MIGSPVSSGLLADILYWMIETYFRLVEIVFGLKEEKVQ